MSGKVGDIYHLSGVWWVIKVRGAQHDPLLSSLSSESRSTSWRCNSGWRWVARDYRGVIIWTQWSIHLSLDIIYWHWQYIQEIKVVLSKSQNGGCWMLSSACIVLNKALEALAMRVCAKGKKGKGRAHLKSFHLWRTHIHWANSWGEVIYTLTVALYIFVLTAMFIWIAQANAWVWLKGCNIKIPVEEPVWDRTYSCNKATVAAL